ncbi:helix-turn-helix domain-containing protein [Salmonella enterica subsp. enterica serovar Sandiego]|nr:helix-turn-helix domain-containing protein [Salmonella enterica subsp. enterica serovar Sandiego]EIT4520864.1 helix-turn-helix domain-containing protein [Salmonella enterica subsp. enterica serovar Sandiego]
MVKTNNSARTTTINAPLCTFFSSYQMTNNKIYAASVTTKTVPEGVYPPRPAKEINDLIQGLSNFGKPLHYEKGQRLQMSILNEKVCYIILNGHVSFIYHQNNMMMSSINSRSILGIGRMFYPHQVGYFRAESSVSTICLTQNELLSYLNNNPNQWQNIATYTAFIIHQFCLRETQLNVHNSYLVVRYILLEMNSLPSDFLQNNPAYQYIMERTILSRSTIMSILSRLKKGGYIELKNGRLFHIHHLPEEL